MSLFRLTLATIIQRKVWVIMLLCVALFPIVLPYLTPHNANPTLIEPARAQAAWVTLWVVSVGWILFQAAGFGDNTSRSGLGSYFLSGGMSRVRQMIQLWLACVIFLLPLVVVTLAVATLGAMPSGEGQVGDWVLSNLQYALLLILVVSPLILVAISLGSRFGATAGYVVPLFIAIYGMYGVGYFKMMTEVEDNVILDTLYVFSPHYHLSDLTSRLIFDQGAMLASDFMEVAMYFLGVKIIFSVFSGLVFRAKSAV